jgi:hypothetical protein
VEFLILPITVPRSTPSQTVDETSAQPPPRRPGDHEELTTCLRIGQSATKP